MKTSRKVITREELQRAIRGFQERGGLIRRLPDEFVPPATLVGARWGAYEEVLQAAHVDEG